MGSKKKETNLISMAGEGQESHCGRKIPEGTGVFFGWENELLWMVAKSCTSWSMVYPFIYTMWGPPVISCWFISPSNYSYKYY